MQHIPELLTLIMVGQVDLTKGGPGSYRLRLNGSEVEAEVHSLRDGGLLVQVYCYIHSFCKHWTSILSHSFQRSFVPYQHNSGICSYYLEISNADKCCTLFNCSWMGAVMLFMLKKRHQALDSLLTVERVFFK